MQEVKTEIVLPLGEILYNERMLKRVYEMDKNDPTKTADCIKNLSLQETYREASRTLIEEFIDKHPEWIQVGAYKLVLDTKWSPKGLSIGYDTKLPRNNNELNTVLPKDEDTVVDEDEVEE